jgi:glycosyltransferase involved in cell wall biosynthesis
LKTFSVCIAAYKAAPWIMECYESFVKQEPVPGYQVAINIGVDGCDETAKVLTKKGVPYFWNSHNHGCYIMLNSLLYAHPADIYCHFGADDVAMPNFVKELVPVVEAFGFCRPNRIDCDVLLNPMKKSSRKRGGGCVFTHEVLEMTGGFEAYRVASDTAFMRVVKSFGISSKQASKALPGPLFYRRRHGESLTRSKNTGMKSSYRAECRKKMFEKYQAGFRKVDPITIKLELVGGCEN